MGLLRSPGDGLVVADREAGEERASRSSIGVSVSVAQLSSPRDSIASLRSTTSSTSCGCWSQKKAPIEYRSVSIRDWMKESVAGLMAAW